MRRSGADVLIPVAFVKRWLEESVDATDFRSRLEAYVAKNQTNWTVPD